MINAEVAQLEERHTCNVEVEGAVPFFGSNREIDEIGRHAGLRNQCWKALRFESLISHQSGG